MPKKKGDIFPSTEPTFHDFSFREGFVFIHFTNQGY